VSLAVKLPVTGTHHGTLKIKFAIST